MRTEPLVDKIAVTSNGSLQDAFAVPKKEVWLIRRIAFFSNGNITGIGIFNPKLNKDSYLNYTTVATASMVIEPSELWLTEGYKIREHGTAAQAGEVSVFGTRYVY